MRGELEDSAPVVARAQGLQEDLDRRPAVRIVACERHQARARARIARIGPERRCVRLDGLAGRVHLLALHVAELAQELRARAFVGGLVGASLEELRQVLPAASLPQKRRERESDVVGVAEVAPDLAPGRDGLRRLVQSFTQELRAAHAVGAALLVARCGARPEREHLGETGRVAASVEHVDEPVERLEVRLVLVHAPLPELRRALVLPQLRRELRGTREGLAPGGRVFIDRRDALEHVEPVLAAPRRFEQRVQSPPGGEDLRVRHALPRQDRREERDGARGVADSIGPHGRRLHRERDALLEMVGHLGRRREQIRESFEARGPLGQLGEPLPLRRVARVEQERGADLLEGVGRVPELLVQLGELRDARFVRSLADFTVSKAR